MSKRPLPYRAVACDVTRLRNCTSVWQKVVVEAGMVRSCCAVGCTVRDIKEAREAGVQFYRIPQNETKRVLWVNAIRRKDWQPSASTVICSQHFVGGKCVET